MTVVVVAGIVVAVVSTIVSRIPTRTGATVVVSTASAFAITPVTVAVNNTGNDHKSFVDSISYSIVSWCNE